MDSNIFHKYTWLLWYVVFFSIICYAWSYLSLNWGLSSRQKDNSLFFTECGKNSLWGDRSSRDGVPLLKRAAEMKLYPDIYIWHQHEMSQLHHKHQSFRWGYPRKSFQLHYRLERFHQHRFSNIPTLNHQFYFGTSFVYIFIFSWCSYYHLFLFHVLAMQLCAGDSRYYHYHNIMSITTITDSEERFADLVMDVTDKKGD